MYAGFWRRVAATLIDTIIYTICTRVIQVCLSFSGSACTGFGCADTALLHTLVVLGFWLFYFVYAESSPWQATLGKKIVGIKVTDLNGQRISFWRALARDVAKSISNLTLGIGYLMCIWTEQKQCLHDKIASCLVVTNDYTPQAEPVASSKVPVWVILVALFLPCMLIIGILTAIALPQYFSAVERARIVEARKYAQAIKSSGERYYLKTGKFPGSNPHRLDIQVPESAPVSVQHEGEDYFIVSAKTKNPNPVVVSALLLPGQNARYYCAQEPVKVQGRSIIPPKEPQGKILRACNQLTDGHNTDGKWK